MSLKRGIVLLGIWIGGQGLWLSQAYRLEFLGENTFLLLWLSGILFFLLNIFLLIQFIVHHSPPISSNLKKE